MTIQTKYNLEDIVYYLDNMRIHKGTIDQIELTVFTSDYVITSYTLRFEDGMRKTFKERELFLSKEELISAIK